MAVDLDDLAAFAAVAQRRSFRRAAADRGVSASTLSQAVRDLEARLGERLLHRTTRSVGLTEQGAQLLDRIAPALAEISTAVDQVRASRGVASGLLRINAPQPAIELVLAPLVAPFLKAHPHVRLEVVSESSLVDIVAEGFDAGVRWGEHLARDMVAVPLGGTQRFVVVAAPGLIGEVGTPRSPHDLMALPCIRQKFTSGLTPAWEFEREGAVLRIDPPGRLVSTNPAVQLRAAADGLGFYATFEDYAAPLIAAGRLVTVLDDWTAPFPGPYLYYPSRERPPAPLRAFIDFVKAERRRSEA